MTEKEIDKWDEDYSKYLTLKWDSEHGTIPSFKMEIYDELKKKFEK